jgi:hypothetical protein
VELHLSTQLLASLSSLHDMGGAQHSLTEHLSISQVEVDGLFGREYGHCFTVFSSSEGLYSALQVGPAYSWECRGMGVVGVVGVVG